MINPTNTRQLAESLSDTLDRVIPESQIEKLSQPQRNFLATLIYLYQTNQPTRDGKHPLVVIKDILGIKTYLDKKETFLKIKKLI